MTIPLVLKVLSTVSIAVAAFALVKDVWARRGRDGYPLAILTRERFGVPWGGSPKLLLLAFLAGVSATFVPVMIGVGSGVVRVSLNHNLSAAYAAKALVNVLIIFLWAAAEELTYRGSVLTALLRFCSPPAAIVGSALLFALEHVGSNRPDWTLDGVWLMDGICFAIAYLLTHSLWMPTVWHAAHNLGIWCMGWFVVQLTPGILQVDYGHWGARVTGLYGLTSAAITLATIAVFMRATRKKSQLLPSSS